MKAYKSKKQQGQKKKNVKAKKTSKKADVVEKASEYILVSALENAA